MTDGQVRGPRRTSSIRVLQLTNLYPSAASPVYGIFVKDQIDSLDRLQSESGVEQLLEVIEGRAGGRMEYIRAARRLAAIVSDQGIQVVHAHHLLSGAVATLAKLPVPIVVSFMNQPGSQLPGWPAWIEALLFRFVQQRASHSVFKTAVPEKCAISGPTSFLPNGVDLDAFTPVSYDEARTTLGIHGEELALMFVSANDLDRPAKRRDRFDAVCRLLTTEHGFAVRKLEASDESRDMMRLMYSAADCHVLTSDHEGSPNSIKEALACNCRVVATAVGSVPELLSGIPGCGVVFEREPRAIAHQVADVCAGPRPQGRRALVDRKLDQASVAARLVEIYFDLAAS